MKKRQKSSVSVAASDCDLESVIHSNREFFDHLLELIPEKFYLPNDEDSKPWVPGLSKAAKASLKQRSKENLKLARRRRFDPETKLPSSGVSELVPEQDKIVNFEEDRDSGPQNEENSSVTYEELREKLRRKIELMRGNRGGANGEYGVENKNSRNANKKRNIDEDNIRGGGRNGVAVQDEDGEEIIEYGKVALDDDEEGKNRKKKKAKLSKAKELERAKKLQETKRGNPGIAEKETWKAATNRAMGVKVHDDARLIKESMKKEKRKKEKNAEKWKERVATQEKMKEQRQQKRKDNITGRINDKKMRKIAKREKKLMRPGFEGRKDNYITKE